MSNDNKKVNAAVLIIGNEILSGRTQEINLSYLSKWLNKIGITVRDALVIYNWLFYAQKIKDENVKKFNKKIPYSNFIDKKLI